jgi:histidyl-tRNA synthetase
VEEIMRKTAHDYGFKEIRTPVFERTELFVRGFGEGSDIVSKEMYTFLDKAERSMSLRPEGTASVMRAFIEKRLYQFPGLHKFFYIGPMFRYERPQAGRYRQHHQFGAEAIGIAKPHQDAEMIDMLYSLYRRLGLKDLTVMINSVGDEATRAPYRKALCDYLQPHAEELSPDSRVRLNKNPLRILDSKDLKDQKLLEGAPSILDFLSEEAKDHFQVVQKLLSELNISYVVNPKLVRGLDYYNKTVFEITYGDLGAQNTIGAGGRYDGLIASLEGPDLPAVGWATGIERLLQTMNKQNFSFPKPPHPFIFLIALGEDGFHFCFSFLHQLREHGIPASMDLAQKKLQQSLQLANSEKADFCLVIGDEELQSQKVKLKNMATRETLEIPLSELLSKIQELYG